MIVPMRKLELVATSKSRDEALGALRGLGVVHIVADRPPSSEELEKARDRLAGMLQVRDLLPKETQAPPSGTSAAVIVDTLLPRIARRRKLMERLDAFYAERAALAPWGEASPQDIQALEEKGLYVGLFWRSKRQELQPPEGAAMVDLTSCELGKRKQRSCPVAMVSQKPFTPGNLPRDRKGNEVKPLPLPQRSLRQVEDAIHDLERNIEAIDARTRGFEGDRAVLEKAEVEMRARVEYLEARQSMGRMGDARRLVWLRGWVPAESEESLLQAAARHGWAIRLLDPEPDEEPPTYIRNPRWVRPIKTVFEMIGVVPGYRETDISPIFLIFLSIFFAMLVGDAGYGVLFIAMTIAVQRLVRTAPRQVTSLLYIMSGATVLWGALTGTWFGITNLPAPLAAMRVDWLTGPEAQDNVILLSFLLGAIHLTIAHLWRAVRYFPSPQFLAQLGWAGTTWVMFFAARSMVLLRGFPPIMFWVLGAGALLVVAFMTPLSRIKNNWFEHAMLPLKFINNFVDVVSYVRLFAVGAASLAMARAFNEMAVGGGLDGVLSVLLAAVVLFLGHGLNILLAAMGVLVHGVRLNTLEFAQHMDLTWSGTPYRPFSEPRQSGGGKG
ncbi:V-type ATP synthase subunit I [Oceanidesulfovibrio marinus]|uniref:V-type ATP synthase subunit I n=1 Tax=Oceanidesulfovibrio marinus TaxID=370038 RepID=A0ABX6NF28_9BACT|nr:hypothetical protein [Oceanidesulfovibrio marinus]QJT09228.1 hypothetical protein E8L03_09880 [Oceanidesulfovibrio marinus]